MRNSIFKTLILIQLLAVTCLSQEEHIYNHPELQWSTFQTEHFIVHFHQGTERTANIVGKVAEDIYGPVTKLYDYEPGDKIHFIIKDTDDYSNGAAYFFDNKIEIWAPNMDYIMRGTRNWLRDVVTHEFTHIISIQKSIKFSTTVPYGFFQIFGYERERRKDVVRGFPNTLVSYPISSINIPVWFAEGVAQYQAPGARYDYRDPHREMILRDRIIHDQMLTYEEMGVFGKDSHGNESAYNLGFSYVVYLCDRFGDEILEKITQYCSQMNTLTFNEALKKSTGISADSLYLQWQQSLKSEYNEKLKSILANEVKGKPIELRGFANLYPIWSPDGTKIAYISNRGSDSFGSSSIILFDRQTREKRTLSAGVISSISWSPDGRFLVFARHTLNNWSGSAYKDLYLYDLEKDEEIRLTKYIRAKNPDWSHKGNKIVFVTESNGLNQLCLLTLENQTGGGNHGSPLAENWKSYFLDSETGEIYNEKIDEMQIREVQVRGGDIKRLLTLADGRQIFHPRWSPDDKKIIYDTAIGYGRNIAVFDIEKNSSTMLLKGKEELRYPIFHPNQNAIYYSSSETGIYNLYKFDLNSGEKCLLTNVAGGAMMPDINKDNELVYACYDSLGYHIYTIPNHEEINSEYAFYEKDYLDQIPEKNFDDSDLPQRAVEPYQRSFTGVHFLPRLLIDYSTIKPGFYIFSSDVLDKLSFLSSADVNFKFDYDLYGRLDYRELRPNLFVEAINLNQNITDTLDIPTGEKTEIIDQNINFNLLEVQAGAEIEYPYSFRWRLAYIISLYHAKINWNDPFIRQPVTFRYRYLDGRAWQLTLNTDQRMRDHHKEINPRGGRMVSFRYTYEDNDFLVDFKTGESIGIELYKKYVFHKFELDWEEYFSNPLLRYHSFAFRLRAGYIDRAVNDFFYLYGGGFIGMKGYSYYSFGGTKKLITTFTYRFPIFNHIDAHFLNIYFDKLYLGLFYDYGNAWIEDELAIEKFKRDIGFQLRLETFTNYLFPTRFFFEAAYPLEEITSKFVKYNKDWRFYFGVLFEFDVRERFNKNITYRRQPWN